MDHSILARGPDLVLINKKKKALSSSAFFYSSEPQTENERKRKERYILGSCQRGDKDVLHEGDDDINNSDARVTELKGLEKRLVELTQLFYP